MRPPVLNRRMVLESAARNSDGAGGFVESWAALGELWVELKPRSGSERDREDASVSRLDVKVTVRAAPMGSTMRPMASLPISMLFSMKSAAATGGWRSSMSTRR